MPQTSQPRTPTRAPPSTNGFWSKSPYPLTTSTTTSSSSTVREMFATPDRTGVTASVIKRCEVATPDSIDVYLRIRPPTAAEDGAGEAVGLAKVSETDVEILRPTASTNAGRYTFDKVLDASVGQEGVFRDVGLPLIHKFFRGTSSLVFAYGVTNAGKTFTVHGSGRASDRHDEAGVGLLPRVVGNVLQTLHWRKSQASGSWTTDTNSEFKEAASGLDSTSRYGVLLSCLEIYKDNLRDLLGERKVQQNGTLSTSDSVRLVEEKSEVIVKGAREVELTNYTQATELIAEARRRAQTGSTSLNNGSSRSHSVFILSLIRCTEEQKGVGELVSKLVICDLAGSERISRTGNTGQRLEEAKHINRDLTTLGRCLQILRENQERDRNSQPRMIIPYRETKITRLFQSTLSGNGKTVMLVNVSPSLCDLDESVHVLGYSATAKSIVYTPLSNSSTPTGTPVKGRKWDEGARVGSPTTQGNSRELSQALQTIESLTSRLRASETRADNCQSEVAERWRQGLEEQEEGHAQHVSTVAESLRGMLTVLRTQLRQALEENARMREGLPPQEPPSVRGEAPKAPSWEAGCQTIAEHKLTRSITTSTESPIVRERATSPAPLTQSDVGTSTTPSATLDSGVQVQLAVAPTAVTSPLRHSPPFSPSQIHSEELDGSRKECERLKQLLSEARRDLGFYQDKNIALQEQIEQTAPPSPQQESGWGRCQEVADLKREVESRTFELRDLQQRLEGQQQTFLREHRENEANKARITTLELTLAAQKEGNASLHAAQKHLQAAASAMGGQTSRASAASVNSLGSLLPSHPPSRSTTPNPREDCPSAGEVTVIRSRSRGLSPSISIDPPRLSPTPLASPPHYAQAILSTPREAGDDGVESRDDTSLHRSSLAPTVVVSTLDSYADDEISTIASWRPDREQRATHTTHRPVSPRVGPPAHTSDEAHRRVPKRESYGGTSYPSSARTGGSWDHGTPRTTTYAAASPSGRSHTPTLHTKPSVVRHTYRSHSHEPPAPSSARSNTEGSVVRTIRY